MKTGTTDKRRSPHGERGLKYLGIDLSHTLDLTSSLPAWGAWIEILAAVGSLCGLGRSPHGERGLKSPRNLLPCPAARRSPHGERGLKFGKFIDGLSVRLSLPAWGAWIEISRRRCGIHA